MTSIFPLRSDRTLPEEQDPEIVELGEGRADELFDVLSSATAREIIQSLAHGPKTPSELTDQLDTTSQNIHYHLSNLQDADAIEVIETEYSERGREMNVYAPSGRPLVIVSDTTDDTSTLRAALKRLLGAVGVLAILSAIVQLLTPNIPTREAIVNAAGSPAMPPPPGILFFSGGLVILLGVFAWWYVNQPK